MPRQLRSFETSPGSAFVTKAFWVILALGVIGLQFHLPASLAAESPTALVTSRQDESKSPTLRWEFSADQVFIFDFNQTTAMSTMVAENPDTKNGSTEKHMIVQWKVLSADEQSATIEMVYQQIDFAVDMEGRATASTNADQPTVGTGAPLRLVKGLVESVQPMINQPIQLTVTPTGKITGLKIEKSVVDAILRAPNTMSLRNNLTQEGVESVLSTFLTPLPETALPTWERTSVTRINDVPLTSKTVYSIDPAADTSGDSIEIRFETNVSFPAEKLAAPKTPSELKNPELKGKEAPFNFDPIAEKWPSISRQEASGTIQFNITEGYPTSAKSRSILVTEKAQSNFLIETTLDTNTEVKITRQ